jgi:small subunit ribosomal protein S20
VANIKSQIKRNRQNDKRRLRNRVYRGTARIAVKSARTAIDTGIPESKAALLNAVSALDKAAEQGVLHKNNAARRKSRLMKAFNKMEPAQVMDAEAAKIEPAVEAQPKKAATRKSTKAEAPAAKKTATATKKAAAKK